MKGPAGLLLKWRGREFARYLRSLVSLAGRKDLLFAPELIERPEGRRALVLSPHCDDEVIGLGGLLCRHARDRDPVTILYFTVPAAGQGEVGRGVAARRKEEARKATAILGIEDLLFLDQPEGGIRASAELADCLARILGEKTPEIVYLPWFLENHVDHVAVNAVFREAWNRWRGKCTVCAYEVWTLLAPNRVVDITDRVDLKEKALAQYASQLEQVDYVGTTLALNRYRSVTNLKGRGYAEAFLCLEVKEYLDLFSGWFQDRFVEKLARKSRFP